MDIEHLQKEKDRLGVTYAVLAERAGVCIHTIWRMFKRREGRSPRLCNFLAVAKALEEISRERDEA